MLKRVLIANRGEIALRILRACRELGIETVAAYSQADADALHVQLATQSVCIGPAKAADSYLNPAALLSAAMASGCDGLHPGYGFLSENPDFADACAQNGITFIGPSGDAIRKAGSKSAARDLMRAAGVPVTPGSDGPVSSVEDALAAAGREKLCAVLQITDTGLTPGSGVGNHRREVSQKTLGMPVLALGLPTVIRADQLIGEEAPAEGEALFVTPRDIDQRVRELSRMMAYGIDLALQPHLTVEDITGLLG